MKKIVVLLGIFLLTSVINLRSVQADAIVKLQRALQRIIHVTGGADDLGKVIKRFIVYGSSTDDIESLRRLLELEKIHPNKSKLFMEALEEVAGHDADVIAAIIRKSVQTTRTAAKRNIVFPKLLSLSGFSKAEINNIFQLSFGHPPKLDLLRLKDLGYIKAPAWIHQPRVSGFFMHGNLRVTLNPPAIGLSKLYYKEVLILDDTGRIIKKIPLQKIDGLGDDLVGFVENVYKLIDDMAAAPLKKLTAQDLEEGLHGAERASKLEAGLQKISFSTGTTKVSKKTMNIIEVTTPSGSKFKLRLKYDAHSYQVDYKKVVWSMDTEAGEANRILNWDEVASLLGDDAVFHEIRDFLISQRATEIFRR